MEPLLSPADQPPPPVHVAIIMDGNGRWAEQRKRPRLVGHRAGARAVRDTIEFCVEHGVEALTLFAFSSENWARPQEEVSGLMRLVLSVLDREVDELARRGARIRFIGEPQAFSHDIRKRMAATETLTAANTGLTLVIAANYGGRQDIAAAARALAQAARDGRIDPDTIDEQMFGTHVALADLPAVDLCIRTGGDLRISNFLLWQLAYAELWFTPTLWPDMDAATLQAAFDEFSRRQRRFGLTGAQVTRQQG